MNDLSSCRKTAPYPVPAQHQATAEKPNICPKYTQWHFGGCTQNETYPILEGKPGAIGGAS